MQAGYVHPENQGAFQSGALRSIDISTLDRTPRVIEPRTREIYRINQTEATDGRLGGHKKSERSRARRALKNPACPRWEPRSPCCCNIRAGFRSKHVPPMRPEGAHMLSSRTTAS
jgi:hypothetical protein